MKARGYWEKDGTRHALFGGSVPEGAVLHEGEKVPGPPPAGPDPRDQKLADLEAELIELRKDVDTLKGAKP